MDIVHALRKAIVTDHAKRRYGEDADIREESIYALIEEAKLVRNERGTYVFRNGSWQFWLKNDGGWKIVTCMHDKSTRAVGKFAFIA